MDLTRCSVATAATIPPPASERKAWHQTRARVGESRELEELSRMVEYVLEVSIARAAEARHLRGREMRTGHDCAA